MSLWFPSIESLLLGPLSLVFEPRTTEQRAKNKASRQSAQPLGATELMLPLVEGKERLGLQC